MKDIKYNQVKICKRFQSVPLFDFGTAGCLIPTELKELGLNESQEATMEQESVILATDVLKKSKSILQDKVLTIGNKIFTPIKSHHQEIKFTEVEMIEDSNQEISASDDNLYSIT